MPAVDDGADAVGEVLDALAEPVASGEVGALGLEAAAFLLGVALACGDRGGAALQFGHIDGARLAQLARDNGISLPTTYRYLHEGGITVLAEHAPGLSTALKRAAAAGYTHLNLDGTAIRTDRVPLPAPTARICGGPASTSTTGETCRSSPPPTAGRCGSPRSVRDANTTPPAPAPTA